MSDSVPPEQFIILGTDIIRKGKARPEFKSDDVFDRKHLAFFGTTPFICSLLWAMLEPLRKMPTGVKPVHLLWSLLFMKTCGTEAINCALVGGPDEKTFRKWTWIFIDAIAALESQVLSVFLFRVTSCRLPIIVCLTLLLRLLNGRSFGATASSEQRPVKCDLSPLMELTLRHWSRESHSFGVDGSHTSTMDPAFAVSFASASRPETSFGSTAHLLVESGPTCASFGPN